VRFADTNVLLYAISRDAAEQEKAAVARPATSSGRKHRRTSLAYLAQLARLVRMATERSTFTVAANGAAFSTQRLRAWPSLSQAAEMLGLSLSALSRAMDAQGIAKHRLGRRARKIAPVALLDLAVEYGADVANAADEMMSIAERSGAAGSAIAGVERDLGAWFATRAAEAEGPPENQLRSLIEQMRETVGDQVTEAILTRAGVTAPAAAGSAHAPS
jgi:predicted nucleic acid-binding protein